MPEYFTPTFLHRIPHLSGTENFNTWRIQMEDILTDLDLLKYVNRTHICPAEVKSQDDDSEHKIWLKNDRKALINIRLRVSEHVLTHIQSSTTSADAWDLLESIFQVKGTVGLIDLRRKFFSHRMEETDDLEAHIQKMRTWYQQINDIAPSSCTEADWITTLVASLPNSWDTFTQSIDFKFNLKDKNKLANQVSDIRARIIAESHRRNTRNGGGQSFFSTKKSRQHKYQHPSDNYQPRSHRYNKSNSQCYNCGKHGHWTSDCYQPGGGAYESSDISTDQSESEESPDEQNDSPKRHEKRRKRPHTRMRSSADETNFAFMATDHFLPGNSSPEHLTDAWIAESGTTIHIANNRNAFIDYMPVHEAITSIAGKEPIIGRGTVLLRCRTNPKGRAYSNITLTNVAHVPTSPANLISLSAATDKGFRIMLRRNQIKIISPDNITIASGKKQINQSRGNLWQIDCQMLHMPKTDSEVHTKHTEDVTLKIPDQVPYLHDKMTVQNVLPIESYANHPKDAIIVLPAEGEANSLECVAAEQQDDNRQTGGATNENDTESKYAQKEPSNDNITTHLVTPEVNPMLTEPQTMLTATLDAHSSGINEAE